MDSKIKLLVATFAINACAALGASGCVSVGGYGTTGAGGGGSLQELTYNLEGARGLVQLPNQKALQKFTANGFQNVFDQQSFDLEAVYVGPQNQVVVKLDYLDDIADCNLFLLKPQETKAVCLNPRADLMCKLNTVQADDLPTAHRAVQFDAQGNIYYCMQSFDSAPNYTEELMRWDAQSGATTVVNNNASRNLQNFVLDSENDLWMGWIFPDKNYDTALRYLSSKSQLSDVCLDVNSCLKSPQDLFVADAKNVLIVNGGLSLLNTENKAISAFGPEVKITQNGNSLSGARNFQWASNGDIYALVEHQIMKVYPGVVSTQSNGLVELTDFRIFGDKFYYVGKRTVGGEYTVCSATIGDANSEVDLLLNQQDVKNKNIEIYHFAVIDNVLYFDGQRFFDGLYFFGKIDLANNNEVTIISEIQNSPLVSFLPFF